MKLAELTFTNTRGTHKRFEIKTGTDGSARIFNVQTGNHHGGPFPSKLEAEKYLNETYEQDDDSLGNVFRKTIEATVDESVKDFSASKKNIRPKKPTSE